MSAMRGQKSGFYGDGKVATERQVYAKFLCFGSLGFVLIGLRQPWGELIQNEAAKGLKEHGEQ